jgi:tetratricopeptide (TPR) repeat protein
VEPAKRQPPGPPREALDAYERGMSALQKHDYAEAAEAFTALTGQFPAEQALLDRARVYLELCRRALDGQAPEPETAEEKLTAATAALNDEDEARAESLSRSVLADDARNDMALYLLAAVEVRRGMAAEAVAYLAEAIAISPDAGAQARQDPDFVALHDNAAFRELTGLRPDRGREAGNS